MKLMISMKIVEQTDIITSSVEKRILVNAGPGTGKTWTLIERVLHLVSLGVEPDSIQILCFSRAAVEVIKRRMREAIADGRTSILTNRVDIRSFDSFASQLLYWVRDSEYKEIDKNFKIESLNYDERIDLFCKTIISKPQLISQCNHLIVDEVQDLVLNRASMVLNLIKLLPKNSGVTLFGDACQSIYDYQVNGGISSSDFYRDIEKRGDFSFYTFYKNYRQVNRLKKYSDLYRTALITDDLEKCENTLAEIDKELEGFNVPNIRHFDKNTLYELAEEGKVAVLVRSNAQALIISDYFHKNGIHHVLQRRLSDNYFNGWIAVLFNMMRIASFDQNDFTNALIMLKPNISDETATEIWEQISEFSNGTGRVSAKDMLCGIRNNGKNKGLFIDVPNEKITVSTIHRSKGREYDNVLILDNMFSEKVDSIEEHKVNYVALSRAKNNMYKTRLSDVYFRTLENRRCFTAARSRAGSLYLRAFEVGRPEDMNYKSFACINGVQKYLRKNCLSMRGKEIYLEKHAQIGERGYISYNVILKETGMVLGWTSKQFLYDLEAAIKNIKNLPWQSKLYDHLYPKYFTGLYVMDIASEIGLVQGNEVDVKEFSTMIAWNTVLVEGYARAEYR